MVTISKFRAASAALSQRTILRKCFRTCVVLCGASVMAAVINLMASPHSSMAQDASQAPAVQTDPDIEKKKAAAKAAKLRAAKAAADKKNREAVAEAEERQARLEKQRADERLQEERQQEIAREASVREQQVAQRVARQEQCISSCQAQQESCESNTQNAKFQCDNAIGPALGGPFACNQLGNPNPLGCIAGLQRRQQEMQSQCASQQEDGASRCSDSATNCRSECDRRL
jgi:flagellar biosynthesis GTPase FlhF